MSKRERTERLERLQRAETAPWVPNGSPALRVSDVERQVTVATLQRHFVAGRLTDAELGERIKHALDAQTQGDLMALLSDLPVERASEAPAWASRGGYQGYRWSEDWGFSPHVRAYLGVMVLLVAIWLMTTPGGYFWPMWPALGWGIGLFAHGSARKCGVRREAPAESRVQMT